MSAITFDIGDSFRSIYDKLNQDLEENENTNFAKAPIMFESLIKNIGGIRGPTTLELIETFWNSLPQDDPDKIRVVNKLNSAEEWIGSRKIASLEDYQERIPKLNPNHRFWHLISRINFELGNIEGEAALEVEPETFLFLWEKLAESDRTPLTFEVLEAYWNGLSTDTRDEIIRKLNLGIPWY